MRYSTADVGDRQEWILRLLYAPYDGKKPDSPTVGTTRLMKGCFLIHRKLEEEHDIKTDFDFRPDKYGPLDPMVYTALEQLEDEGYITAEPSRKYDGTEYALTDSSKEEVKEIWEKIDEDVQQMIIWVKTRHLSRSLTGLLSFVYEMYPDMAVKSEVRGKLKRKNHS